MTHGFIMVPGIGGSGPEHWQSHWEELCPRATRIAPASWDRPDLADWIAALDRAVAGCSGPPVLICHSLGCLLFAHWRVASSRAIAAAFLVAVPDPAGPAFPPQAEAFGALPVQGFGRGPVLAVASSDDPYDPRGRGIGWAAAQGARPCHLGPRGHLNGAATLGAWPEGQALLAGFLHEIGG
ncbi:RBBP9/YdeN family alpha/beta hydrolase [Celeribacter indicus]|uniref:Serine hydrolase family protein n=1 Tax=Celeribacter indicus TaxID=1208324 RepID=A0A0B5DVT6_9RHOB|nr:alpha/beta hydrolase [Celeribacter indicus]AJE47109.1 hypothetical protein P73_2394 [Celeribacter indicus]SDW90618.1 hypothetical protein SAMN05443573_10941 [Celeribacter indicus]